MTARPLPDPSTTTAPRPDADGDAAARAAATSDPTPGDPAPGDLAPDDATLPPLRTVGWVNVRDGRLLAVRTTGKDRFFMPGGKVEPGESDADALVREIHEELGVRLDPASVRPGFVAEAPGHGLGGRVVRMHCMYAEPEPGSPEPAPSAEIAELAWLTPGDAHRVPPAGRIVLDRLAGVLAG